MKTLAQVFPILSICLFFISSCQGNHNVNKANSDSKSESDTTVQASVDPVNYDRGQELKKESGKFVVFHPEKDSDYLRKDNYFIIYNEYYYDRVCDQTTEIPHAIVYAYTPRECPVITNDVKESNGAYFLSYGVAPGLAIFSVYFKDYFYFISSGDENFGLLNKPATFDISSHTIIYYNINDEKRTIDLSTLPEDKKIKVNYTWY